MKITAFFLFGAPLHEVSMFESVMESKRTRSGMAENPATHCIISRELVDSTFRNQRIIIESEQKQARNLKIHEEIEDIKKQIETLEKEKREKILCNQEKKRKIQKMKTGIEVLRSKTKELQELAFELIRYNSINGQSIPNEILLKCKQEIEYAIKFGYAK
jgi:hypothetical protein